MNKPTLVIMAAGMGSRFGGCKQITPVDDRGHAIIDYSIYDALRAGGAACAMLNAANETAVEAFLAERIPFGRIWQVSRDTLEAAGAQPADTVEAVFEADALARRTARGILARMGA